MAFLRVIKDSAPESENVFVVHEGSQPTTVGRDASATVTIDDERASRKHCRIIRAHGSWFLQDLKSSNGTLLNREPVEQSKINSRCEIRIGATRLIFFPDDLPPAPDADVFGTQLRETLHEESGVLVYRSYQPAMDRDVRVDILSRSVRVSTDALEAIRKALEVNVEDDALIPTTYADLDDPNQPFLVLKAPSGKTLASQLDAICAAPLAERISVARSTVQAILARAKHDALNAPISPAHVWLDRRTGSVQVTTVEMSAFFTRFGGSLLHLPSYASYVAPECVRSEGLPPANFATSLYGAGAIAYHLITGRPVTGTGPHRRIVDAHASTEAPAASSLVREIGEDLSRVLGSMLAKKPEERPTSAQRILQSFDRALDELDDQHFVHEARPDHAEHAVAAASIHEDEAFNPLPNSAAAISDNSPARERRTPKQTVAQRKPQEDDSRPQRRSTAQRERPTGTGRTASIRPRQEHTEAKVGFFSGALSLPIWAGIWAGLYYGARLAAVKICEIFDLV